MREVIMFGWALFFFIFAVVAALLGFGGIAGTASSLAQIAFYIGLILFVGTLIYSLATGRGRPTDRI
jgi:uncharacterized membrane protein YtjA (UPF0391 family)